MRLEVTNQKGEYEIFSFVLETSMHPTREELEVIESSAEIAAGSSRADTIQHRFEQGQEAANTEGLSPDTVREMCGDAVSSDDMTVKQNDTSLFPKVVHFCSRGCPGLTYSHPEGSIHRSEHFA